MEREFGGDKGRRRAQRRSGSEKAAAKKRYSKVEMGGYRRGDGFQNRRGDGFRRGDGRGLHGDREMAGGFEGEMAEGRWVRVSKGDGRGLHGDGEMAEGFKGRWQRVIEGRSG